MHVSPGTPGALGLRHTQERFGLRERQFHRANQLGYLRGVKLPVVPLPDGVGVERRQLHALQLFDRMAHRQQTPTE